MKKLLLEGGVAGHLAHLYDNKDLSFNKIAKILSLASKGKLVGTEKTDGYNIYLGYKDGKAKSARNKTHMQAGGIDADQLGQFSGNFAGGGIGGLLDAFTGGAFSNASIFALGIMPYISASIVVQLMGIAEIGKQAQPFDSSVLDKIRIVHESFPEKMISIDGSVNPETIQKLAAAGANRFVAGSAIVGQPDEVLAYQKLAALVN